MLHLKTSEPKYKKAIFPGSFNDFHLGHFNVLMQADSIFDEIIIFVGQNPNKPKQNFEDRKKQIANFIQKYTNKKFNILGSNALTTDIAKENNCKWIIRGLRDVNDFEYEMKLQNEYKKINPEIQIVYFTADSKYIKIRSSK
ncbi:MAG: pantetheine-phosphate adenylyltransferase [Ureaplasma sp.]|nr:pantetheine-phosphate adenylyltransferase [Ureaplasma sp.]